MKSLIVHTPQGFTRYEALFERHVYDIESGVLHVYSRDLSTGQESLIVIYRDWTHVEIEGSHGRT